MHHLHWIKLTGNAKELVIDFYKTRTNFPTIRIDGTDTQRVTSNLTWDVYFDEINRKVLLTVYLTVVRPTLEYAWPAWLTSLTFGIQSDIERVQRRAMNIIHPNISE